MNYMFLFPFRNSHISSYKCWFPDLKLVFLIYKGFHLGIQVYFPLTLNELASYLVILMLIKQNSYKGSIVLPVYYIGNIGIVVYFITQLKYNSKYINK